MEPSTTGSRSVDLHGARTQVWGLPGPRPLRHGRRRVINRYGLIHRYQRSRNQGASVSVGASLDSVNTSREHMQSNCLLRGTAFEGTLNN